MDTTDNESKGEPATNQDSTRCIENGQGSLLRVGEEPPPELEPSSHSNVSPSERTQARCDNSDLGDIPVEEFAVPVSATVVPGLRPPKEKSVRGVSGRRKANAQSAREDEAARTNCEIDALAKHHYATSYALDADELPVRMPKLPFASRLAVDTNEGAQFAGDGGYQRWLDHRPFPMPPKEGEVDVATVDKTQRPGSQPRIPSRELLKKQGKISQDTSADLYPMGLETRLPPFPQAIKISKTTKDRSFLSGSAMMMPVVNVNSQIAELTEDDDEDSWAQEITNSPRTITCGGTCRLDALVTLTGMSRTKKQGPPKSAPSDSAMSSLSDFVGKADDKVLSYILDVHKTAGDSAKPKDKSSTRLAPGQPLPGQVPGFPLQL